MRYPFSVVPMVVLLALSQSAFAQEAESCSVGDDSVACQQKVQIDAILVDMNKSSVALTDDMVSLPAKALDAGCLDNIKNIDTSIFTIDPASIWTTAYAAIKDQLRDRACSAIEDKVNQETARLTLKLEAPYGLGSVNVGQTSGSINEWRDIITPNVQLSNEDARQVVIGETFGEMPVNDTQRYTEPELRRQINESGSNGKSLPSPDAKEQRLEKLLKLKTYWKDDESTGAGDNTDGSN